QGRYAESQALLEHRLQLREAGEDKALHVESRELLACSTFHQGLFADTLEHARKGLAAYEPEAHDTLVPLHGHNLQPACHAWTAHAPWFLGRPGQALAAMERAVQAARDLAHGPSLASA